MFHVVGNSTSVFVVLVFQNGTDYGFLVRQNSELLRALDELEKTCSTLREENGLLVRLKITRKFIVLTEGLLESRPGSQRGLTKPLKWALFQLGAISFFTVIYSVYLTFHS